jgi:hypothetical protein
MSSLPLPLRTTKSSSPTTTAAPVTNEKSQQTSNKRRKDPPAPREDQSNKPPGLGNGGRPSICCCNWEKCRQVKETFDTLLPDADVWKGPPFQITPPEAGKVGEKTVKAVALCAAVEHHLKPNRDSDKPLARYYVARHHWSRCLLEKVGVKAHRSKPITAAQAVEFDTLMNVSGHHSEKCNRVIQLVRGKVELSSKLNTSLTGMFVQAPLQPRGDIEAFAKMLRAQKEAEGVSSACSARRIFFQSSLSPVEAPPSVVGTPVIARPAQQRSPSPVATPVRSASEIVDYLQKKYTSWCHGSEAGETDTDSSYMAHDSVDFSIRLLFGISSACMRNVSEGVRVAV